MHAHLSVIFNHNVAVVAISNPQDECSYTVASTGPGEQIHSHVIPADTRKDEKNLIPLNLDQEDGTFNTHRLIHN